VILNITYGLRYCARCHQEHVDYMDKALHWLGEPFFYLNIFLLFCKVLTIVKRSDL